MPAAGILGETDLVSCAVFYTVYLHQIKDLVGRKTLRR